MDDLFAPDDAPVAIDERTMHGKVYVLRPVLVDKQERWAVKWRSLDGSQHGGIGGYYATPELAWSAVEHHPEALAALQSALKVQHA